MECCGNCGNSMWDPVTQEYICGCESSDGYGLDMSFTDWCEEWCEK